LRYPLSGWIILTIDKNPESDLVNSMTLQTEAHSSLSKLSSFYLD